MSTARVGTWTKVPFEYDILSQPDFGDRLPEQFRTATKFEWGMAVGAMPDSWDERIQLEGIDWRLILFPPADLKLPRWTGRGDKKTRMLKVARHCALVVAFTGAKTANEARDAGRGRVRSLLALLRREVPMLLPADLLWEGLMAELSPGKTLMSATDLEMKP